MFFCVALNWDTEFQREDLRPRSRSRGLTEYLMHILTQSGYQELILSAEGYDKERPTTSPLSRFRSLEEVFKSGFMYFLFLWFFQCSFVSDNCTSQL